MNAQSKRQYLATIAAANPADVAHYRRVMEQYSEYPYEGIASTPLTRALWLEKTGQLEERPMTELRKYLKARGLTARQFADECKESPAVIKKLSAGCYKGAAADRVMAYVRAHPVEDPALKVELNEWRRAVRQLDGLIAAGNVRGIEIHVEVAHG